MKLRIINTLAGYLILSFGVATVLTANIAYSPTDVVLTVTDNEISFISYSVAMVIMHGVLALIIIIIKLFTDVSIKYTTIITGFLGLSITAFVIGFFKDTLYGNLLPNASDLSIFIRILMFIPGYLMITLGAYLFVMRQLITPPYDLLPVTVSEVTGIRMSSLRIVLDSAFTLFAVIAVLISSDLSFLDDLISIVTFSAEIPLNAVTIFMGVAFGQMFKIYEKIPLFNIGVQID